jgi:acyl-CoA dehydrogenase
MDLTLPPTDRTWQHRAREFAETVLFPRELPLEDAGSLSTETKRMMRDAVVVHGLNAVNPRVPSAARIARLCNRC